MTGQDLINWINGHNANQLNVYVNVPEWAADRSAFSPVIEIDDDEEVREYYIHIRSGG